MYKKKMEVSISTKEFVKRIDELVILLKYYEDATENERNELTEAMKPKRPLIGYIENTLRIMAKGEEEFQEHKKIHAIINKI